MFELRDELRTALHGETPRLAVVRPGGLGDTLLALPALQAAAESVAGLRFTLVGSAWAERLKPLLRLPAEVARFDSPAMTPLFASDPLEDATGLFSGADAVVIYSAEQDGQLARNARRFCDGPVIEWPVEPATGAHAAAHFASALSAEPVDVDDMQPPPVGLPELPEGCRCPLEAGRQAVAVHPGSGGAHKCWPAANFARLVRDLSRPLVLVEGPADAAANRAVSELLPQGLSFRRLRDLELPRLAAELADCRLFVGNDSGLTHFAAALGVSVVAVFGPTDPAVWRPLGREVRVVRGENGGWPPYETVVAACRGSQKNP